MDHDRISEFPSITVEIPADMVYLLGELSVPPECSGVVLFAHGSGSSRFSPRNRSVAAELQSAGFTTLLADLLTSDEEEAEAYSRHLRFDIELLTRRLTSMIDWLGDWPAVRDLPVGLFGASTGAAAALSAAALDPVRVGAVVSRGGRPDLAGKALRQLHCPVLLIVGGDDDVVIQLNQEALEQISSPVKELVIVQGASHLFEEPGTLEDVARHAVNWFARHLASRKS